MRKKVIFLISLGLLFSLIGSASGLNITLFDDNTPPNPPVIVGPTNGKIKEHYLYNITITDPDEDNKLLKLEVDFGDGIVQEDCGCDTPWENGEVIQMEHVWKKEGNYEVTGRVADENNEWSQWSEPIIVTMPKNKLTFKNLLLKIIDLFPSLANFYFF
jgi:hypothetical protein